MTRPLAVVAHCEKRLGGGLPALKSALAARGFRHVPWYEVDRSRKAPKRIRRAIAGGAELVLVWGGDGMVRRAAGELAGTDVALGVLPAGTANLFANNLGIPIDLDGALEVALAGVDGLLDVGVLNGERFVVMAGTGFDAELIADADAGPKERLGRAGYLVSGARATGVEPQQVRIEVDGQDWFEGEATCVLVGNVGTVSGGLTAFTDARPDDGVLDVGVVRAKGRLEWARVFGRMVVGKGEGSPFVDVRQGKEITVRLERRTRVELDGGARDKVKRLAITIEPAALRVRLPVAATVGQGR